MLNPYLYFNGNAREAITFYAHVFQQDMPQIVTLGEMPADPSQPFPDEAKNLVMHAQLSVADGILMFSDSYGAPVSDGGNISLMLSLSDGEIIHTYWDALSDGATIDMPLSPTFWSPLYGMLTDKFGVQWQLSQLAENSI